MKITQCELKAVFNRMSDGIVLFDAVGKLVDTNSAALSLHGCESVEEIKHTNRELFGEAWDLHDLEGRLIPPHQSPKARALRGEELRDVAVRLSRKSDGRLFFGSCSGGPIRGPNGKVLLGMVTIREITAQREQKLAEDLRDATDRIAYDVARVGTFEWDIANDIITWSPELEALYGLEPGTFEGGIEGWRRMIHPDDLEGVWAEFERSFETGCYEAEFRIIQCGGSQRWLAARARVIRDRSGNPVRVVGANLDIDRQKTAEAAVRESEQKFRTMADGLPLIVWVHGPDGELQSVNKRFCEFYGLSEAEFGGNRWQVLLHPDDAEAYTTEFVRCVREQSRFNSEVRVQDATGRWRWLESWGYPRFTSDGIYQGHVGASADVTNRKAMEEHLRILAAELKAAKETAECASGSKSRFLSHVSHEIRTPLTAIRCFAELLEKQGTDPLQHKAATSIRESSIFMLEIIDDLLDLAKVESGTLNIDKKPVNLFDCLTEVRNLLSVRARAKGLSLELQCEGSLPKIIQTDPLRLRQILINLTANAIKFTSEGHLIISVRNPSAQAIEIDVTDTGIGISEEDQKQLFESFFQAKDSCGGTGLGLPISKQLAALLGGDITVKSALGKGSTFRVRIDGGNLTDTEYLEQAEATAFMQREERDRRADTGLHR